MNRILTFTLLLLCCSVDAVQTTNNCKLGQLDWLNGKWQTHKGDDIITEQWKTLSDVTMEGVGFTQNQGESGKAYETLRILEMSGDLFLLAKVAHNDMPIPFKAVNCHDDSIVFINKKHDFPNQLHYQLANGVLVVDVRDNQGNGFELSFSLMSPD